MPNQMIALQARAPQTDVLGASIQRNAQMMNMMSQQRASERQAAQAAQQMEIARAQEARAAAGEERAAAKFAIDQDALLYAKYRNMAPAVIESNNPEVYAQWLGMLNEEIPQRAQMIAKAMPPEQFDKETLRRMMASMDQSFEARYGKAITKELIGPTGEMYGANISGLPGGSYAAPLPDISKPISGATPATPSAAPTGGLRPTRGVNTTPADLRAQMTPAMPAAVTPERLDAAARAVARGASITDPMLRDLSESDFLEVQKRASRLMQNSPEFQTMSAGGAAQPDLAGIVQTMMDTGVVSRSNLEAMRAAAGPGKDAQLAEILRSNNIRIMPDEQPAGGMRSAVYRPEEGAAAMTQAQYDPNAYQQMRVKSPLVSPSTPSKTPEQIYREEKAREKAKVDAAREAGPKPLTPTQEARLRDNIAKDYKAAQSTLDMMLNPVSGVVAAVQSVRKLTPEQKEAITGFSGYIPSVTASSREADTKVKNLMGKVTEMGKAAASLNGAIGQMAVQEWRIVRDMIANLDLEGMEPSDLDNQLDIIETQARRAAAITQDAYENQYIEEFARYPNRFQLKAPDAAAQGPRTNTSNLPRVRNDADFNRLKPGTLFIDPNGETRRKP